MKLRASFISVIFVSVFFLLAFTPGGRNKQETADLLVGTWVQKQDLNKNYLRYVKTDQWKKNTDGFLFREDGTMLMYTPLGCQTPVPNYTTLNAKWRVLNRNTVEIDRQWPGAEPEKMKIEKLSKGVLRFSWR